MSTLPSRSLPPELPKLFPTVSRPFTLSLLPSRSLPTELSPSYFPRFPVRPPCRRFCVAPSRPPSSPQAISHGFPSVHPACRSLSSELSPSYFPRFPVRPPCPCTLPWLPPNGALPKLFFVASVSLPPAAK